MRKDRKTLYLKEDLAIYIRMHLEQCIKEVYKVNLISIPTYMYDLCSK
jgi:hypothetical protein